MDPAESEVTGTQRYCARLLCKLIDFCNGRPTQPFHLLPRLRQRRPEA
jgi:hypothetical protein